MKNRIDACFEALKAEGRKALVTFVTAGDPDLATTENLVTEMFDSGADLVEIGVPFSDPIAEGGTIQRASLRSLKHNTNLDQIFEMVSRLRDTTDKPILLMMYINTVFRYGTEKFFDNCKKVQIDGVIIPDMPFEERDEVKEYAEKTGVRSIYLVAPTSKERVKMIAEESKGFLYIVSSLGVTGTRSEISTDFDKLLAPLKEGNYCPACIGFGISNGEQAKKMASYCDGCIIGSAIVNIVEKYGKDSIQPVGEFVKSVREELDS
ncbi:tryptophan synthase subunit alpha [Ruminococcus sp.]|uniref:tryptophan synthase subunit alpha n=1 Tax=Ruminococcus sp. TaxID=41978 RepID=UPI0025E28037|nr:tryptophan synthase subunit alpha [Ruminococcus sp.]MBQ9540737.1 tryptophan synthase subunit alpha [Ruminococcus sp.]